MKINNIICKRESINYNNSNIEDSLDYLTIYDQDEEILIRSDGYTKNQIIELEFQGLIFIALPNANDENDIFITVSSLNHL
jgi:hypothetical protein